MATLLLLISSSYKAGKIQGSGKCFCLKANQIGTQPFFFHGAVLKQLLLER
jgi:hypothetical protein